MLAEFGPEVQEITHKLEKFLKKEWGFSSIDELAPLVLIFQDPDDWFPLRYPMICYPMVVVCPPESTPVFRPKGEESGSLSFVFTQGEKDWKWEPGLALHDQEYEVKGLGEYNGLFHPRKMLQIRKFRLGRIQPLTAFDFGEVKNRKTGESRRMILLSFKDSNPAVISPMGQFNTAAWFLDASLNSRYELGEAREDAPRSGHG